MVIDQIRNESRRSTSPRRCDMSVDECAYASTDIYWKSKFYWKSQSYKSRFTDLILKVRIILPQVDEVVTKWRNIDAFLALLVLPRVDESGCEVPFEYEHLTTAGIAELRSDMYDQLC